jgi:hypothetical protein
MSPIPAQRPAPLSPAAATRLYPDQARLSDSERERLDFVQTRISQYLRWGRIDPEDEAPLRAVLIELGDRLIADVARSLGAASSTDIDTEGEARDVIAKIDLLAYLAASHAPLARETVMRLATRPVEWGEDGKLRDPAAAAVTFEAFDTLARLEPDVAAAHAARQPEEHRRGYVVHYVYGRRLAGRPDGDIAQDISLRFGPQWSALAAE